MSNSNGKCKELQDELDALEVELRFTQEEFQTAAGAEKLALIAFIRFLREQIADVEKELEECISRPRSNIGIFGIEQTQATQFFRPRLNPCPDRPGRSGPCPDNDIKLVVGKTTVLRIYVNVSNSPSLPAVSSLTGVLNTKPVGSKSFDEPTLTPYNAPIPPQRRADIDRGIANHTLNFRIPAQRCRGKLEVNVTAFDASHPGEDGFTSRPVGKRVDFLPASPLKIRLVRIRYKNDARGMDIPAPTIEDFWTTAQFTLKTYPIPGIVIVRDSEELYDGDFTSFFNSGGAGAQGTTGVIFQILKDFLDAEGLPSDVQYFALIPGVPANQTGASGWATLRKNIGEVFNGPTMAQELGHNCCAPPACRGHAPCGNPGGIDPNYPTYSGYPMGSIGEFGFDFVDGTVYDPATTFDFMSYCAPAWVSPYTYEGMISCYGKVSPAATIQLPEVVNVPRELLYLSFTIHRNRGVIYRGPNFHLKGFIPIQVGPRTPYSVELHDKDEHILDSQQLRIDDVHKNLDDAFLDFFIALPWHVEAAKVVLKREEQILDTIEIGEAVPEVKITSPTGGGTLTGQQKVDWIATCHHKPLSYILLYSNDGGQSWHALATRLTVSEYTVDLDNLPGGEKCLFQVLASEGIRTGVATSDPFVVPSKPLKPLIISPGNGDAFVQGESVHLFGVGHSPGGSVEPEALNWSSSIDGFLGSGSQLIVHTLSVGRHCITLNTDDACGGEASTSIYIVIRPREFRVASVLR